MVAALQLSVNLLQAIQIRPAVVQCVLDVAAWMGRREMAVSFRLDSPHHRSPDDFDKPTLMKQSKVVSLMRSKHPVCGIQIYRSVLVGSWHGREFHNGWH